MRTQLVVSRQLFSTNTGQIGALVPLYTFIPEALGAKPLARVGSSRFRRSNLSKIDQPLGRSLQTDVQVNSHFR